MAVKKWIGGVADHTTEPGQADNWSPSGVPADGDSLVFPATTAYNCDGYDFAADRQFVGLDVEDGYTGDIGSAATPFHIDLKDDTSYYSANLAGTGTCYLQIDNYDQINVTNAGPAPGTGRYALNLTGATDNGTATKSVVNVNCPSSASVSIAANPGEDMEANDIRITGGNLVIGSSVTQHDGSTAAPLTVAGGTVVAKNALGTVTKTGGTLYTEGSNPAGTLNTNNGKTYLNSAGTVTTLRVSGSAVVSCANDPRPKTITTAEVYRGGSLKDPNRVVTFTNPIELIRCGLEDVTLELGQHIKLTAASGD